MHDESFEFLDGPDEESRNEGPQLHHFRTHNLKCEQTYLESCWKVCIEDEVELPVDSVRISMTAGTCLCTDSRSIYGCPN